MKGNLLKYKKKVIMKYIPILLGVLAAMMIIQSCTIYKQPAMKITSVLAVTAEGDTLKLPIDVIRPIYNYNNYPRSYYPYNNFYYTPNRYYGTDLHHNGSNGYIGSSNNNSNNNSNSSNSSGTATIRPGSSSVTPPPNPTSTNNPRKNN
jgi:hypothetical protein